MAPRYVPINSTLRLACCCAHFNSSKLEMSRRGKYAKQRKGPLTGTAFDPLPLPSGVPVPMCFCGDPCKVDKSEDHDTYRQRYWMCANFAFEPTVVQRRMNLMTPPPLCVFEQWIDTEISEKDKKWLENLQKWDAEDKERMKKRREELAAEQQREDEEKMRRVAECREDKEKKLERARRAKEAMEENPDAFRKGKWPRCTQ
ncbi:uncharacterized protein [Zea mays]|uniref:uncharacterized protein n=1 Tax=Zea mays TaxID=4577 RepID=UPI0009AA24CF|nr:uncharacterized protein LOC109939552 [Zea mays]|eukprot:XP_020393321.1 uncharacterized protein LOC109939552 [Zea mays]